MAGTGLDADIRYCKGVGEKRAALFAAKGIRTVGDLVRWHPIRYDDRRSQARIAEVRPPVDRPYTFFVKVHAAETVPVRFGRRILKVLFTDGTGFLHAVFFHPKQIAYFSKVFRQGAAFFLTGKPVWDPRGGGLKLGPFDFEPVPEGEEGVENIHTNRIVPIYSEIPGISPWFLRALIFRELKGRMDSVPDPVPEALRLRNRLPPLGEAYRKVHFPATPEEVEEGRGRLAYDRFLYLAIHLQVRRRRALAVRKGFAYPDRTLSDRLRSALPFRLTPAQERVVGEIFADLERPEPMNRLLQGDVGSGKTVVALLAMLRAVGSGHQACLVAPTEILARQHKSTIDRLLSAGGPETRLLVGGLGKRERQETLEGLASGRIPLVVGTHALLEEDVVFRDLTFVVVDEQHKFGVEQRLGLLRKAVGGVPDLLAMTATPIPRTLGLTLYGDLDLSVIHGLPPGRKPVETRWYSDRRVPELYAFVRKAVEKGEKAYFIYPAVEESEAEDIKAVTSMYEEFVSGPFRGLAVGLVHGRLPQAEKELVMERFRTGEVRILVATTVVEVGVDVPDATILVVENAERFGLAQLHQLRGRVGRGDKPAWCLLVTSDRLTEEGRRRMAILRKVHDGFRLAEEDLRLRGPGEFLGTRQSGLPDLFPADLVKDGALLEAARRDAIDLLDRKVAMGETERRRFWTAYRREAKEMFEYVRAG